MKLTLIYPCVGRRPNEAYIGTWQMEPLPAAAIAGLTPKDVDLTFYDDRMEAIPFDAPADLVAITVETYTAKRAYQIAGEYRRRGVPVVMGGFHASLCPNEVAQYAEAVVIGEAEDLWPQVIDDFRSGRLQKFYRQDERPSLRGLKPDRSIFRGKRYLPIGLLEAGRGCKFGCDFCAVQTMFNQSHQRRPFDDILSEARQVWPGKKLLFFVDDNMFADTHAAKDFLRALIPLNIRWVGQASINAAHDEEFLDLLVRSGCEGLLIGFESLNPDSLKTVNKGFNTMRGGYEVALANLRRYRIKLYAAFIFGFDTDTVAAFAETIDFALRHRFYIAAFAHLLPFPGTPLFQHLLAEGRMLYPEWWIDDNFSYNQVPFQPKNMSPQALQANCLEARREFYRWPNLIRRSLDPVNRSSFLMFRNFFLINGMLKGEVSQRDHYPLGDMTWRGELLKAV